MTLTTVVCPIYRQWMEQNSNALTHTTSLNPTS
jgi:hypothetical protein